MQNEHLRKQKRKYPWLGKLGSTAFSASILLAQSPASADPLVQHLLNQAASRVVTRREDHDLPTALVLTPSTDNSIECKGHSSHSSHSSHRSGTGGGSYVPPSGSPRYSPPYSPPPTTPKPPPTPKHETKPITQAPLQKTVQLRNGSEVVGIVKSIESGITIESRFGTFDIKTDDVRSVKMALVGSTFAGQDAGKSIVTLKNGKKYRGDLVETDTGCSIKSGAIQLSILKANVVTVENIVHPPANWRPPDDQWYWITLSDGSKIRTKVIKDGDDHALDFGYGKIVAKTTEILLVRKIPQTTSSTSAPPPKAEAESPDNSHNG